ncbi:MAG: Mur ligase family protein, partial [Kiritimatiellia bacterium]
MSIVHTSYDHSRVLVLGAGLSGVAAAQLLRQRGCTMVALDEAPAERLVRAAAEFAALGVELLAGTRALPDTPFDLCVTSPGFAMAHPWLEACRARRIPVIAETELGFLYWPGRVLAITGSKGKSSLVKLCADTLQGAGIPAEPAGNYGTPLSRLATTFSGHEGNTGTEPTIRMLASGGSGGPALPETPRVCQVGRGRRTRRDNVWAVVEVSSFQIEHLHAFRPDVAILLNLQADHLDRHASMEEYRALKLRLFAQQAVGDVALLPEGLDDGGVVPSAAARLTFGTGASCDWQYIAHGLRGRHAAT